jgi:hypothetical protein
VKHACDHCGGPYALLAATVQGYLCAPCWRDAGEPTAPDKGETHQQTLDRENAIRAGMTARGSTGRHLVRNGRT